MPPAAARPARDVGSQAADLVRTEVRVGYSSMNAHFHSHVFLTPLKRVHAGEY